MVATRSLPRDYDSEYPREKLPQVLWVKVAPNLTVGYTIYEVRDTKQQAIAVAARIRQGGNYAVVREGLPVGWHRTINPQLYNRRSWSVYMGPEHGMYHIRRR